MVYHKIIRGSYHVGNGKSDLVIAKWWRPVTFFDCRTEASIGAESRKSAITQGDVLTLAYHIPFHLICVSAPSLVRGLPYLAISSSVIGRIDTSSQSKSV